MRYSEFEELFSAKRMQKYLAACNNDTRRAMTLYRYNLKLSQEMFTIISCFEVVLRNRIDKEMVSQRGNDWLRDAILPNMEVYVLQCCLRFNGPKTFTNIPQQAHFLPSAQIRQYIRVSGT
jgi:hypothetical protein